MSLLVDESLDLRGIPCPTNAARALIKIAMMSQGDLLEVYIDDGEPVSNLTPALQEEGHQIVDQTQIANDFWRVVIKICQ